MLNRKTKTKLIIAILIAVIIALIGCAAPSSPPVPYESWDAYHEERESYIQELEALVGTLQQQVDERSIQIQKLADALVELERDLQAATSKTESFPETTPSSPKDYPPVDWSKILPQAISGY